MAIKFPIIDFNSKDLSNIKGVFLDIDDTLYDYQACHKIALQVCCDKSGINNFAQIYKNYRDIITKRLQPQGACRSRLLAFMELFEDLKHEYMINSPYEMAIDYDNLYWDTLINSIVIEEEASSFIKICKQHNKKIVIVTDMLASVQIKKLQKLDLLKDITYLVTSEQAGSEKSQTAIFNLALQKIQLSVNEIICVGDSLEKDYSVPMSLKIKSFLVERS